MAEALEPIESPIETTPADVHEEAETLVDGAAQDKVRLESTEGHEPKSEEHIQGEHIEGEYLEGENEEENSEGEEYTEGEETLESDEEGEGEQVMGEEIEGEQMEDEEEEEREGEGEEEEGEEEVTETPAGEEVGVEEEVLEEEPPPDPAAPYDFSDSKEALREPFELRPDQVAEVETLWEVFQNYTPAYTDIDGYITEKELIYMLKSLLLMTYTPEQLQELIEFCVRPPHPDGHINFEQFKRMVTLRQRDFNVEEELRSALQVLDPEKTGLIDRAYFREHLANRGFKTLLNPKQQNALIKEVDITDDGTLGIEDIVGTMGIDLNREDIIMMQNQLNPNFEPPKEEEF